MAEIYEIYVPYDYVLYSLSMIPATAAVITAYDGPKDVCVRTRSRVDVG